MQSVLRAVITKLAIENSENKNGAKKTIASFYNYLIISILQRCAEGKTIAFITY